MKVDNYELDFGILNNLIHYESLNQQVIEPQPMEDLVEEITVDMKGLSVPKAATVCGISRSGAYRLLDEFNSGDGHVRI
ncbi:uncharacterized protein BX663DRAFT_551535 [Cokeromyces recurvatus]|uniref:uncharacterized protein n=1 Tax=Cokeromyces recurvatus TaxID=90255 RepID=UPI00221FD336|nr:uncharacterized protein BX663DRAFT_551535 [Cokeromyces recurvatus]KAI7903230.1 hypothetical protein BX663DRAFT_551535 [Cokeromyces recurvatus]